MTDPAAIIAARLEQLWRTSRPIIQERVAILQTAHDTLTRSPEDPDARSNGREAAHKLAGTLGMFGLPRGSELASEIETLLRNESQLTTEEVAALGSLIAELDSVIASRTETR